MVYLQNMIVAQKKFLRNRPRKNPPEQIEWKKAKIG